MWRKHSHESSTRSYSQRKKMSKKASDDALGKPKLPNISFLAYSNNRLTLLI